MSENVVAIIQARMGSSRLPGKILRPLGRRPMLEWVLNRVHRAKSVSNIVVATTNESRDDELVDYCNRHGWNCSRGSEQDVLARFVTAAQHFSADLIVRITADCPFVDPALIDQVVAKIQSNRQLEYCCNFLPQRTFPRGLDVECLRFSTLMKINSHAISPELREHVTLGIYRNQDLFSIAGVTSPEDYSDHRWTVDTHDDWQFANQVAQYFDQREFDWRQMLTVVNNHPHWIALNSHVAQKVA